MDAFCAGIQRAVAESGRHRTEFGSIRYRMWPRATRFRPTVAGIRPAPDATTQEEAR